MIDLYRASEYARLHQGKVMVFKVGGACLARESHLKSLARQLSVIAAFGVRPVVVHGGGQQTAQLQELLGEEPQKVDGRRITTDIGLRALRLATIGDLNSALAARLTAEGTRAIGLCCASAGIVTASKRPPMETSQGVIDFGLVGDVISVAPEPLQALSDAGFVPVLGPPAYDGEGGFLNVNADSLAASLAVALGADKLILLSDTPGILRDPKDSHSVLSALSLFELEELSASGAMQGGMSVKAAAIRMAIEGGVNRVHVVSGLSPDALLGELYTTQGTGTLVTDEKLSAPTGPSPLLDAPKS